MRRHPDVHLTSTFPLIAVLALAGCRSDSGHIVRVGPPSAQGTAATAEVVAVPLPLPRDPSDLGVTSMQGEPDADVYSRPPLHEPNGSPRYSDVGMPYPIPDVAIDTLPPSPPQPTSAAPPAAAPAFPETSFRPPYESKGFPESSFGPDAEP
jgi:hypothetical protein